MKTLCEVLLLYTSQEIALRGHREDEMSANRSEFLEILSLVAKYNKVAESQLNGLPTNAVYKLPKIQNDLAISYKADMVHSHITSAVRDVGMF